MRSIRWVGGILPLMVVASSGAIGCNRANGNSQNYPLVEPPVKAVAPAAFGGQHASAQVRALATLRHLPMTLPAGGGADDGGVTGTPPGGGGVLPDGGGGGELPDGAPSLPGGTGAGGTSGISAPDIAQRFFGAGPTDVYFILQTIDGTISRINTSGSNSACLTQAPVPFTITPWGESVTMYAQCEQGGTGGSSQSLLQWGQKDGVFYLWNVGTAEWMGVIATPIDAGAGAFSASIDASADASNDDAGPLATNYAIHAWIGVGQGNGLPGGCGNGQAWDACSYGVVELATDPLGNSFEMSVAGTGFGYCGAEVKSDGTNIYAIGSPDMGSSCVPTASICVSAADGTTPATCTSAETTFSMVPELGRETGPGSGAGAAGTTSYGASQFPGDAGDTVILNGTSTDAIHFGPDVATAGVGAFNP